MDQLTEPDPLLSTGPLLALRLEPRQPLGLQIERQLRTLIREEALPAGAALPSTRAFAADLGVSRGVVVGAYAQLAAEGYITVRRGAPPLVAALGREPDPAPVEHDVPIAGFRFNLRPDLPDLALFPRSEWLAASRASLHRAANSDLAYGEPFGSAQLRRQLAPFLARTRGVVADPALTGVVAGSTQAIFALGSVLRAAGATRVAVEDPGHRWRTAALAASGVEAVPVAVDGDGLCVDRLPPDVDAVVVSPDHHFPLGVALSADRRRALVHWAVSGDRLVIEHDYDGHFRYDRPPAGTLQALAPDHVAYVGSASALLAPTVRLGWLVVPARYVVPLAWQAAVNGIAPPRLSQFALAELIDRGRLDRHLRKARAVYKRRRAALCAALEREVPGADVGGVPAGLFVRVSLPPGVDEDASLDALRRRGVTADGVARNSIAAPQTGLALGFAAASEPALRLAVEELAAAVREVAGG
jgi:GntR family transcriptional regulator / MocR family aminotransferase